MLEVYMIPYPKAPCSYMVHTWSWKELPYHYLRAYVYTIKLHGAFGLAMLRIWNRYHGTNIEAPTAGALLPASRDRDSHAGAILTKCLTGMRQAFMKSWLLPKWCGVLVLVSLLEGAYYSGSIWGCPWFLESSEVLSSWSNEPDRGSSSKVARIMIGW